MDAKDMSLERLRELTTLSSNRIENFDYFMHRVIKSDAKKVINESKLTKEEILTLLSALNSGTSNYLQKEWSRACNMNRLLMQKITKQEKENERLLNLVTKFTSSLAETQVVEKTHLIKESCVNTSTDDSKFNKKHKKDEQFFNFLVGFVEGSQKSKSNKFQWLKIVDLLATSRELVVIKYITTTKNQLSASNIKRWYFIEKFSRLVKSYKSTNPRMSNWELALDLNSFEGGSENFIIVSEYIKLTHVKDSSGNKLISDTHLENNFN